MHRQLIFATSNSNKFFSAAEIFAPSSTKIIRHHLEINEIQGSDSVEIAIAKARSLRASIAGAFFVEDGSFHIEALGGFPGVYMKYVLETIGIVGFMRLLDGNENRRCYFQSAVAYSDDSGRIEVFSSRRDGFRVSRDIATPVADGWSEIWRILELDSADESFPIASTAIPSALTEKWKRENSFYQLAKWLENRT